MSHMFGRDSARGVAIVSDFVDICESLRAGQRLGNAGAIETESRDAFAPRVAVNRSGTVQAIWRQHDGMRFNVWASRYE